MEFRILGPMQVHTRGEQLPIGQPRVRTVLAILLSSPNTIISVDRFIDELWPDQPPADARSLIHGYLSCLRRALQRLPDHPDDARLVTRKPGYLLRVDDGELDRQRHEQLLTGARAAREAGRLDDALARYREARQVWRGQPYADVPPTACIGAAARSLTELRLTCLEEQYEIELQLGGEAELLAELTELVATRPHRERLVGQLMRAQHHAGRTAEALTTYNLARKRLADELGIDPGPELQRLELAILRGELDPPTQLAAAPAPAPATPRPAQLPADLASFTGRQAELHQLLTAVPDPERGSGPATVVVSAIDGMAGIGKTAVAVHAAHQFAHHFPDGGSFSTCMASRPMSPRLTPPTHWTGCCEHLGKRATRFRTAWMSGPRSTAASWQGGRC